MIMLISPVTRAVRRQAAILKLLHKGSAKGLVLEDSDKAVLISVAGEAMMSLPRELAVDLLERDLIAVDVAPLHVLTTVGAAWLARHEQSDLGFRAQHGEMRREAVEDENRVTHRLWRDAAESPLSWLRSRRNKDGSPLIDDMQFAAGEKLRADVTRGQLMARTTANWDASVASGRRGADAGAFTDATIAARERSNRALAAVGPELSGILLDICCFLKPMETVERERSWPARSGRIVLGLALTRLADHYGMRMVPATTAGGRIKAWRDRASHPH